MGRLLRLLPLVAVLTLAACGGSTTAGVRALDPQAAVAELAGRTVIDVRTPAEFAAGRLDGAVNLDLQSFDFRDQIDALDRGGKYLIYCHSGNRSAQAAAIMDELGFEDVVDGGGLEALAAAGAATAP